VVGGAGADARGPRGARFVQQSGGGAGVRSVGARRGGGGGARHAAALPGLGTRLAAAQGALLVCPLEQPLIYGRLAATRAGRSDRQVCNRAANRPPPRAAAAEPAFAAAAAAAAAGDEGRRGRAAKRTAECQRRRRWQRGRRRRRQRCWRRRRASLLAPAASGVNPPPRDASSRAPSQSRARTLLAPRAACRAGGDGLAPRRWLFLPSPPPRAVPHCRRRRRRGRCRQAHR
jgi:hypothetical protein